MEVST